MRETNPWRTLVGHFWRRFFDTESLSPQSEPEANFVQALGLLASPSAFFVIICLPLWLQGWDQVAIRYYFVSFSMLVMAGIVALQWPALLPDSRDYTVISVLPVRRYTLFTAKLAALGIFLAVFLVDVNFFSSLFWPGIDGGNDLFAIMTVHGVVVVSAGLFAAVATAALFGVLMSVLSTRMFRKAAVAMQTLLIALLVMLLFLTPMLAARISVFAQTNTRVLKIFPPYWFISLYERLRPLTGDRGLLSVWHFALIGLAAASSILLMTFALAYRRQSRRLLESTEGAAEGARERASAKIARTFIKDGVQLAVFEFMLQTITRSSKHRLFLATYGGFGVALAVTNLASGAEGLLRMPLMLAFILVSGLRAAFNFPSELRANWVFQVNDLNSAQLYLGGMRKWIAACGIAPLILLLAPIEVLHFGLARAVFHIVFGIVVSVLLVDLMFVGFRKIPFTCSYFPGKVNLAGLSVLYLVGLTVYAHVMADFESWLEARPVAAFTFLCTSVMAHLGFELVQRRRAGGNAAVDYEDTADPVVRTLDLTAE